MAKRRPSLSLAQMQDLLGYDIDLPDSAGNDAPRFYSDLTAVPADAYEKTKYEVEEYLRTQHRKHSISIEESHLPEPGITQEINNGNYKVTLQLRRLVGQFILSADVVFEFGFSLPLLLSKSEAAEMMSVAKIPHQCDFGAVGSLSRLPRELRDRIYMYAIPTATIQISSSQVDGLALSRGIGDLSGFWYPFRSNLGLLAVSKQIREEALGLAYRKSFIQLEDMDDFIVFAVSIGKLGHDNVESIGFTWASRSDRASAGRGTENQGHNTTTLPTLHTTRCLQLLEHFRRLRDLRLSFEDHVASKLSTSDVQNDAGIRKLCAFPRRQVIQYYNLAGKQIDLSGSSR
ncbi:hypothetical protein BDW75DRAFT_217505 [Aspergillus navahoensis]